jgi:hypothetical protein
LPVEFTSADAGLHTYELAPEATIVAPCPAHTETGGTVTTGEGLTVTVTCVEAVHPFKSPTTVYVAVEVGLAVTEEPVVALNPVAGLQV